MNDSLRFAARTLSGLFILAIVLTGCGKRPQQREAQTPYVATAVANFGQVVPASTMSGLIAPYQEVAIQSTLTEPADAIYVQEGDHVTKGQVLARLDTADLQAQLASDLATAQSNQANTAHTFYTGAASITQGQQQLSGARATLARDQGVLARDKELYRQGYVSQQQLETDQASVNNDAANVRAAQASVQANGSNINAPGAQSASVEQARAQVQVALAQAQQVRVQISKATIVSPVDGVVVNRNLNPGEYPGNRQIFTLQQVKPAYAVLRGSAAQVAGISAGSIATILVVGPAHSQITGRVVGVLNEIQPGSTQFQVKVLLANEDESLRPGMAIQGNVTLPAVRGVRIPDTAFTDDNHNAIQIVQPDSTVKTVKVSELASNGTTSVVTGISSGTRIVANGQSSIGDGEKVSFQQ
jgi:HlyD family secretion protein